MGSSTSVIATMLLVMLFINVGLAMLQAGVTSLNPDGDEFFDVTNTPYNKYITGGVLDGTSVIDDSFLPSDDVTVEGDSDQWNVFKQAKAWFKTSKLATVLGFTSNMLGQPAGFLRDIDVPSSIALAFQVIWSMIFLLFLTAWFMGR